MVKFLENTSVGRNLMFSQARKQTASKTQGNYPSPALIIDCIETGLSKGFKKGLDVEAQHFGNLVMSSESAALRSLFFATTDMKKETGIEGVQPASLKKVGVLGGRSRRKLC